MKFVLDKYLLRLIQNVFKIKHCFWLHHPSLYFRNKENKGQSILSPNPASLSVDSGSETEICC
jgi:hypothetical protein